MKREILILLFLLFAFTGFVEVQPTQLDTKQTSDQLNVKQDVLAPLALEVRVCELLGVINLTQLNSSYDNKSLECSSVAASLGRYNPKELFWTRIRDGNNYKIEILNKPNTDLHKDLPGCRIRDGDVLEKA